MIGGTWRLLVTGSREWDNTVWFRQEMDRVEQTAVAAGASRLIVVHGACYPSPHRPSGHRPHKSADWLAHLWVTLLPHPIEVGEEPHPADWAASCRPTCRHGERRQRPRQRGSICPTAGNYRNQHMVDRGADHALAFWRGRSPGTRDCLGRLAAAGIPTDLFHTPAPARTA
ncbi:hypothetical protein OOJ91_11990 [Micromonospora lupini]|uniref:hypothetical protein n=1 Tax=Micromonospora lupini TaxID=285679 RepID=UPI0022552F1F|nr:hypothetical protein [Micromonospora lupini]MCX5066598.1 hypothetical protein [Micromonospora lupini]